MRRRGWLGGAIVMAVSLWLTGTACAGHLNNLCRKLGLGWSDGYHAYGSPDSWMPVPRRHRGYGAPGPWSWGVPTPAGEWTDGPPPEVLSPVPASGGDNATMVERSRLR